MPPQTRDQQLVEELHRNKDNLRKWFQQPEGILLQRFLQERYSDEAENQLLSNSKFDDFHQGWYKAQWNLVNDIIKLCDTLDTVRIPTEEEKLMLARQRNPPEPSQAEIMKSGIQEKERS
jgi:hypothetical protein